ncbi:hydrogenase nickel incorporation protein [Thermoplasmatales archaeon SG8-52-1]|nr:MAG: hydrogenase nickel incorporation protein [Thermoplasmatales archaeon SG8-52-1]
MHEWALAESILATAVNAADKEKIKRIKEIVIGLGELQQVEQDIFEFALGELIKDQGEKLKDVKIKIKSEKSNFICNNCQNHWTFDDLKKGINDDESEAIHFIPEVALVHSRCPKCGSPDFEITKGRGVSILSIKGEK